MAGIQESIREIEEQGYCVLKGHFAPIQVDACGEAFGPLLRAHLETHGNTPNRGPRRHYLPMPFEPPCFAPDFFFDREVLQIVRGAMDDRMVADQWGCDVALPGADYQDVHVDYQRPLFGEAADLCLPVYMLVVSFGLVPVTRENGPIEIAPGTHRLPRKEALEAVAGGVTVPQPITLGTGDVLIRHPWALHRGSPNRTGTPRPMASIRYVRRWYRDDSREVNDVPRAVWQGLAGEQQNMMRFTVGS